MAKTDKKASTTKESKQKKPPVSHKEVNYVLTDEDVQNHNLVGQRVIRAFVTPEGNLYIKQFGGNGLEDIQLGKIVKSDKKDPGTYHNI